MTDLKTIVNHFKNNWSIFKQAPIAFVTTLILAFTIAYGAASWYYNGVINGDNGRINTLNAEIDDLRIKLQTAAPEESAKRIDQLLVDLEKAKKEIESLRVAKPDRHITVEQRHKLENNLLAISNIFHPQIFTISAPDTPEAQQYCREFDSVFSKVGIKFNKEDWTFTTTKPEEKNGVFVVVKDKNNPPPQALILLKAISDSGIHAALLNSDESDHPPSLIILLIGLN